MKKIVVLLIVSAMFVAARAQDSVYTEKKVWKGAVNINCTFWKPITSRVEEFKTGDKLVLNPDFVPGMKTMRLILGDLQDRTVNGLKSELEKADIVSFSGQIGALTLLNGRLYQQGGSASDHSFTDDYDALIRSLGTDEKIGVCRHYAYLTSNLATEVFDLESAVVGGYKHAIAQVKTSDNNLVLIDKGVVIDNFNGRTLSNKGQVEACIASRMRQVTVKDININSSFNRVDYVNKYNNFAGFWRNLKNLDNSDRQANFFAGQNLNLFSHINANGVLYGALERGTVGLETYGVLGNNQFNSFFKEAQGLNLAAYLPLITKNGKWRETVFVTTGLYRTTLEVLPDYQDKPTQTSYGLQVSLENYLEYDLTPHFSAGTIIVGNISREISREGGARVTGADGIAAIHPFMSYSFNTKIKLIGGTEVVFTEALPDMWKLTYIPWAQVIMRSSNFSSSIKCEYQPASFRVDNVSTFRYDKRQLQFRVFSERYSNKFKTTNLYRDATGIEIGFGQTIKGKLAITSISVQSDNNGQQTIGVNLGINF